MTGKAYGSTDVAVSKSQDELRVLLRKHGAEQFGFAEGAGWAGIEFVHRGGLVRLRCPMLVTDEDVKRWRSASNKSRSQSEAETRALVTEREAMRVWRVLVWSLKARLVAVEEGLETFEQAFLSHLVNPATGRTVWEDVREEVEAGALQIGGAGMRALGPGTAA